MRYFHYCRKSHEEDDRQALSIESQRKEYVRVFGSAGLEIVEVLEEALTAKVPGRPIFSAMLDRIERGEADGIIAWAPDRLARNSIDAGRVIYMLDRGTLRDLKFTNYTFENNSQGKFVLQIMLANSKYHSDTLSANIRMASRTKLANGWLPNRPPTGYLNEPLIRTIIEDPERFPIHASDVPEMVLAGTHSPRQVWAVARDEWGLRTRKTRKRGGKPLSLATVYKILGNPFYAGIIVWNRQRYPGAHKPVVSPAEFEAVQRRLNRLDSAQTDEASVRLHGLHALRQVRPQDHGRAACKAFRPHLRLLPLLQTRWRPTMLRARRRTGQTRGANR